MIGVLLCAGHGARLKPLTYFKHKCLIKVAGIPVLEYLADRLNRFGIRRIIVNTHYKSNQIQEKFGTRFLYTYEPELLGWELTLTSMRHWIRDEYTVVMNGDTMTNINLGDMFKMSNGRNIMAMDGEVYTGTMIIAPSYFRGDREFYKYQSADLEWMDIGTHRGLRNAKLLYEQKPSNMPKLSF